MSRRVVHPVATGIARLSSVTNSKRILDIDMQYYSQGGGRLQVHGWRVVVRDSLTTPTR